MLNKNESRINSPPFLGLAILWLFAYFLAMYELGNSPLRDFDEATVARVALELSQKSGIDTLLPSIWGEAYLNKPPGLHWLIAGFINFTNLWHNDKELPSEFTIRFVPAFLSTFVVPLCGLIQWKLRPKDKFSSIATSAILLSLLPIARHGRLAMLDGTLLSLVSLLWLLIINLRDGKNNKYRLFYIGLTCSFLLLLKAPLIIPISLAGILPMLGEKIQLKKYLLPWFLLGLTPGVSWHIWNSLVRGTGALWLWWGDGMSRVLFTSSAGSGDQYLVPLIELLEGGWPWILFFPFGIYIAFKERKYFSGKWYLSTLLVLCFAILPLKTQYPWYVMPLWIPFALICGPSVKEVIIGKSSKYYNNKVNIIISIALIMLGSSISLVGLLSSFKMITGLEKYESICLIIGSLWLISGIVLFNKKVKYKKFAAILLFFANFLSLIILMGSSFWLWELNESWPVKPIAEMINFSEAKNIVMQGSYGRPSLSWYASQKVSITNDATPTGWILINDDQKIEDLKSKGFCYIKDKRMEWSLIQCKP